MTETVFEEMEQYARVLKLGLTASDLAEITADLNMTSDELNKLCQVFRAFDQRKTEAIVNTCLRLSRLPLKEPKKFKNFDFSRLCGKGTDKLKSLDSLAQLYEHRNLAFIGPQGIGKTHLAMAFGHACCEKGIKSYFLKATELDQRLTAARRNDRVAAVTNGLVKPSCLIIMKSGAVHLIKRILAYSLISSIGGQTKKVLTV